MKKLALLALIFSASLVLSGCGGDDPAATASTTGTVTIKGASNQ